MAAEGEEKDHRQLKGKRTESILWLKPGETAPESATALVGEMKVLIPMAGLINKDEELARLNKEISKLENEMERSEKKLGNTDFVKRAPAEVVNKEKLKVEDMRKALESLKQQLHKIKAM